MYSFAQNRYQQHQYDQHLYFVFPACSVTITITIFFFLFVVIVFFVVNSSRSSVPAASGAGHNSCYDSTANCRDFVRVQKSNFHTCLFL